MGHSEEEFIAKAHEMIHMTKRDGPLMIFIQLGHLAASAVPLNQSGPERKDIEKVWELQKKVIEDKRLPLDHASNTVWETLGQLREQANDLGRKYTASGSEKDLLQRLLLMIDGVTNLRHSGSGQREPAEEQGPESVFSVIPSSSSGERQGTRNRFSSASDSDITAVTGGPSSVIEASGVEDGFGRTSFLFIYGASIYLQPVRFVDKILEDERESYERSESPQSYDSTPHEMMMMNRSRRRRMYKRTSLGFSASRPSLLSRASSGPLFALRGDAVASLSNSSESPCGSVVLSDDDHLGTAPTFEKE